ncbi:G-protein coupled receptor 55 [Salminus brasiliensis]|uniref:G-protein coupled receptor 55 n=1 Tax=Salminus brasiliensis TaxID=930266 RepID=UPI003B83996C
MNSTNSSVMNRTCDTDSQVMKSLEMVIYIPVFVFGLVMNIAALVVFCFVLKKWTESSIYMTNLALMDLLLLLQLPFKMHAGQNEWSPDLISFCSFLESLYFMGMYGSIYTIACISVDRYIALCHPYHAKWLRSKKNARIVCLTIWTIVVLATLPVYTFRKKSKEMFHCFHRFSDKGWHTALIICLEVFGFLLPGLVLVTCSTLSIRALKESSANISDKQAGTRIIYSSICAFLVPFTPSHVAIFFQYLVRSGKISGCEDTQKIALFVQLSISLSNVTSCLDAICYYFVAKEVRTSSRLIRRSISRIKSSSTSEV